MGYRYMKDDAALVTIFSANGTAGAIAGLKAGGLIGSLGGPVGMAAGGWIGAVVGATIGVCCGPETVGGAVKGFGSAVLGGLDAAPVRK